MSYARILAHYPYVVLIVVLVVVATCLVVSITGGGGLDFTDPLAGFEPRGTEISDKMVAYNNLVDNADGLFSLSPFGKQEKKTVRNRMKNKSKKKKKKKKKKNRQKDKNANDPVDFLNDTEVLSSADVKESFFCSIPDKKYARLVFTSVDAKSMFTLDKIQAMCRMERKLVRPQVSFKQSCIKKTNRNRCCQSWSLGNYIALLQNKTRCRDITNDDLDQVMNLLRTCAAFYHNYSLGPNCDFAPDAWYYSYNRPEQLCVGVPAQCTHYNAIYHILHYLTDQTFSEHLSKGRSHPHLQYSMMFLPVIGGLGAVDLYKYIESLPGGFEGIQVAGAQFGVKTILFQDYLKQDTVWLAVAGCVIFLAIWLYSTSIFITIMTCLAMFWSLELAYFLYYFVFEIKFFPYMNMVTIIIIIAIGADDVFIYCKVWHLAKSEKNNGTIEKIIGDTLRHATLSMLVTSLTTAAAFYSNYISNITAIQCFSIYAGTAVMCNFLLMITWIPASIMLYDKWCNFCMCFNLEFYSDDRRVCYHVWRVPFKVYYLISDWSRIFFEKILPCIVIKLRYLWLFLYGSLGICGVIVIFYYPKLKLPSSRKFQMFASDHWIESYDFRLSDLFDFEIMDEEDIPLLPITVIWGIHPSDNGNRLNPSKKGSLELDSNFDISTGKAQRWLLEFCQRLQRTDFYLRTPGLQLTNCFLENFVYQYMKQPCKGTYQGNFPCCNETRFPYTKSVFTPCLNRYISILQNTPGILYNFHSPGPRFRDGQISAFMVEFLSKEPYSLTYHKMQEFYGKVNRWVTEEMVQAPPEMRRGWFISELGFYDLQNSLAQGTPLAMGVSLAVAVVVAFFTTLNVLISLYAILSIACIFIVTIAALVLLGWELNILESVVITVAIGMSIDYTLHYGVAYRLSPDLDREMRVACSIGRMGSAVSMAALTTFLAGAFMMPSTVLAYQKFGTFLMLLISIGWIYSTFFFQSLLRTIGPQGGFSQFHWPASDCCSPSGHEHVDKTIYAMSESTLSSSSTSNPNHMCSSEIRELEPLTEGSEPHSRSHSHYPSHHHHHHHHHHHRTRLRGQYSQGKARPSSQTDDVDVFPKRETHVTFEPTPEIEFTESEAEAKHTRVSPCRMEQEDSSLSERPGAEV